MERFFKKYKTIPLSIWKNTTVGPFRFQFAIPIGYQGGIEYEHSNWKVLVLGKQLWFKEKIN